MLRPTPYLNEQENEHHQTGAMIARMAVSTLFNAIGSAPMSYFRLGERDMQAEIYHQCRTKFTYQKIIREIEVNAVDRNQILITAESSKAASIARQHFGLNRPGPIYPDLMFHDPFSLNGQWCAVEFKRMSQNTTENKIKADLRAVNEYVSGNLGFWSSVFVLNNIPIHPILQIGNGDRHTVNTIADWFRAEIGNPRPDGRSRYVELWIIEEGRPLEININPNEEDILILHRVFCEELDNNNREVWRMQTYSRSRSRFRLLP
ncbi:MAG: hypothetical protein ABF917_06415 [Gluconobacter oxydans]|uniref:hypothetical protein n=1 Tax=Gluconobacter oxydans TaxID=442 RepID=UPI0039E759CA